jgi:CRP/FNR family transcriptional regulator, anaerobic regulatory protein
MKLIETLSGHIGISEEIRTFLKQHLTTHTYRKNTTLLNMGQVCDAIYFVESGLVREFYIDDSGQDITTLFAEANDFIYSPRSFLNQIPSTESLQVLESSVVTIIPWAFLNQLYTSQPEAIYIVKTLTEYYLLMYDDRVRRQRTIDPIIRLRSFMATYPNIFDRAPGKHLASYLGTTSETVSRFMGGKYEKN